MANQNTHITLCATSDLVTDQRMMRICQALQDAGFEVELIGRSLPNSLPLESRSYKQTRLLCYFHKGKFFYIEFAIRLFIRLLRQKTNIINAVDLDTVMPVWAAAWLRGRVCTYDAHEYFTEVPEVVNRRATKYIWERIATFCIPRMDACYTVGGALAHIFSNRYGVPFATVRNMATFKNKQDHKSNNRLSVNDESPRIILYQGVLNVGRGLEASIAAMQHIKNAELWIAGDGDIRADLEQQVTEMQLQHNVKFLGKLRPEALQSLTEKAYIGLNLLENRGLSYYYSLANKTFDYIQAGVPAIHTQFPEYQALNDQYNIGFLLPDLQPELLAKAINQLLNDDILYQSLQQNCVAAAQILHWEKEKETLLELYKKASSTC
jgi:glycosyltransferase involved in cell wall biosynthesis